MSVELLLDSERAKRNYINKATAPGNRTLNRRTIPNPKSYITRLGYSTISTSYSTGIEVGRLSGSSLNRIEAKKRKDEREKLYEESQEASQRLGRMRIDLRESESEIRRLREAAFNKHRDKSKLPGSYYKRVQPLRFLSKRSKGKIRDKATALSRCLGSKQTFATLTFINDVADSVAIRILNKFFNSIRKIYGKPQYWYVSERQDNGRIHFHIIINKYLPVRRFNALWVVSQYNSGIECPGITFDQVKSWVKYDEENPLLRSELQKNLNPFDIKKIKHINGLSYYLTKYVTKNKNQGFGCSAWHCSRGVSKLFTKTVTSRSCFALASSKKNSRTCFKTGKAQKSRPVIAKYYQLFYIDNRPLFLPEMVELETVNAWIIEGMVLDRIPQIDDYNIMKFYSN